jgi:DMSO/TMAO reductase YedYZ molybdopterin-dependent catalytic subunit
MTQAQSDRRAHLQTLLLTSGCLLLGFDKLDGLYPQPRPIQDPFQGAKYLGLIDFVGESRAPLDTLLGTELDGRLFSDLSNLSPENPAPPSGRFYIRTRASELLPDDKSWQIRIAGLVEAESRLTLDDLRKKAEPQGLHLMECAGNTRATRFGLLSVADWKGVPLSRILADVKRKAQVTRVMVSGFDRYRSTSANSVPGADWVFTAEELSHAFLATEMNGQPLTKDHGAPVRLLVPGWYGCTCIKWVNAVTFIDEDAEATSQMQEFAARTHQQGVPKLAKDYRPAAIDQAAMPTRVEKWLVNGRMKYRVIGILWGGSRLVKTLEIRFNPEEDYVRVAHFSQTTNDPWSFWSHAWMPKTVGTYMIRLRVADPLVGTKRLDSGHYVRSVEVTEI